MDKCIAFLLHEGYEDLEYWVPRYLLEVAGCSIKTVGMRDGRLCDGIHGLQAPIEVNVSRALPETIDALVVPGGHAPDKLRRYNPVLRLVNEINDSGKPVRRKGYREWERMGIRGEGPNLPGIAPNDLSREERGFRGSSRGFAFSVRRDEYDVGGPRIAPFVIFPVAPRPPNRGTPHYEAHLSTQRATP